MIDLMVAIYVTGAIVTFAWAGTHKANFPRSIKRFDVFIHCSLWPVFTIGLIPLSMLSLKQDL